MVYSVNRVDVINSLPLCSPHRIQRGRSGAVTLSQTLGISYCHAFEYDPRLVYLKDHANREGEPYDAICNQHCSVAAFNMVLVRGPRKYNLFPYLLILYPS